MSLVPDSPLEHLSLRCCRLNDSHIRYIVSCIKTWSTTNCSLTFLDLSSNSINSDGSEILAAAFNGNPLCGRIEICLKPNSVDYTLKCIPNMFSRLFTGASFNK